jgi:uncharacterized BrkB/YihY/UPF0761 family membrane protein
MENQNQPNNPTVQAFIDAAQMDAQRTILKKKIARVLTNIGIGVVVLVTVVTAVVVVVAIEANANQPKVIEPVAENQDEPSPRKL